MPHNEKDFEIPSVPEVSRRSTEKFGISKSELDRTLEVGDVIDVVIRGEVVEFQDGKTMVVLRKLGRARVEGGIRDLTIEEMKEKLPKKDE